jgi:hypothetical protein
MPRPESIEHALEVDPVPALGYRAMWTLPREQGWRVNRKRIERRWRLEGHRFPKRPRHVKRAQGERGELLV